LISGGVLQSGPADKFSGLPVACTGGGPGLLPGWIQPLRVVIQLAAGHSFHLHCGGGLPAECLKVSQDNELPTDTADIKNGNNIPGKTAKYNVLVWAS